MKALQAFGLIVGLGLVLNVALQVSSQHLSCDDDEDLPAPPECPPNQGPDDNSTYFPVPYDCRKFFECSNGVAKCFRCAPGTVWNQTLETCDHEAWTECVIVTTTTPAPSTEPSEPTEPPTEPTEPPTTTAPTTTTPTTTTTTPTTTTPTTTTPTTTTPTTTEPTEPPTEPTEPPTEPTEPPTEPSEPTEPPTDPPRSTTTTTVRPPNLCPVDDPMPPPTGCPPVEPDPTYFPYPYNCRKYFQCSNGVAICMQCGPRTVWNQDLRVCDNESFGCVNVTTTVNPTAVEVEEENSIVKFFKNFF